MHLPSQVLPIHASLKPQSFYQDKPFLAKFPGNSKHVTDRHICGKDFPKGMCTHCTRKTDMEVLLHTSPDPAYLNNFPCHYSQTQRKFDQFGSAVNTVLLLFPNSGTCKHMNSYQRWTIVACTYVWVMLR